MNHRVTIDKKFFTALRQTALTKATLTATQEAGIDYICSAFNSLYSDRPISWLAYMLATTWHETAATMLPISERGNLEYFRNNYDITGKNPVRAKKMGNTRPGDGITYRGRGYVQLTWKSNYLRAGNIVGKDLVKEPDLALNEFVAVQILLYGMRDGWFTGVGLGKFLTPTKTDYVSARKIINGVDKAEQIAGYAVAFEEALKKVLTPV